MTTEKKLTWRDVKEMANGLTDEQLDMPVKWWGEEEGGTVLDVNQLPEDYVTDGEAYSPRSEMDPELIDADEPVFVKGTPMIWIY
jgi:hypothetical protein